ncbi:MAG TPA: hypothetical protein VF017_14150 [Thermoanaerobaculia bacterium]|nr:hypothetical protein [Thermoanaerobaculia bacterium]
MTYWITLCIDLHEPISFEDGEEEAVAVGYYRHFGVAASREGRCWELVEADVSDGEVFWPDCRIREVDVASLGVQVLRRAGDWSAEGIWYRSGRIFFPDE